MSRITSIRISVWPLWRKVLFRFFFIYLFLQAAPRLLTVFPGIRFFKKYYDAIIGWLVNLSNTNLFHVKKVLVPIIRERDTSLAWAQQWFFLCAALAGCLLWSILDRKRKNYVELNYWLCLFIRYGLAIIAFNYGFEKVFALQIPFPGNSELATPLGDLLPMRLYWVTMGYSTTYQIFAGLMEVLTGVLLIYRKTVTFGALMGLAVFSNIMIMNFSYDIPAKLLTINLVVLCLYLIANEYYRIACFFILNKPAGVSTVYDFFYSKNWIKTARFILKISFIIIFTWKFYGQWKEYTHMTAKARVKPIKAGIYDVSVYALNNNIIPPLITDSMRWQDVIFEKGNGGSIKTADTTFRQLYKRGYFIFKIDTTKHIINFTKGKTDSAKYEGVILSLHYQIPDSNTIQLWGKQKSDSLYVLLKRSNRKFQLAEKQFHWLTEYSR